MDCVCVGYLGSPGFSSGEANHMVLPMNHKASLADPFLSPVMWCVNTHVQKHNNLVCTLTHILIHTLKNVRTHTHTLTTYINKKGRTLPIPL